MPSSSCTWTFEDEEFDVNYTIVAGEIVDFSVDKFPRDLTREEEREIFELIYDDVAFLEEEE